MMKNRESRGEMPAREKTINKSSGTIESRSLGKGENGKKRRKRK